MAAEAEVISKLKSLFKSSDIVVAGSLYMKRWRFGPENWPGLRVHKIVRSDEDRALHDHPFDFVSIIMKGGYWEHTADGRRTWYGPGSVLSREAETLHRLELKRDCDVGRPHSPCDGDEIPTWTFVIRGRHRREWGFKTVAGWVHNRLFVFKYRGQHYDKGTNK